ncbi:MAG TPA: DJ-1/PfpI family protein [Candidatus Limnocylindrales bacterium]|nr:DJ-1/PfpI family protein [Candidatus Limnocylindrales bacterium]
MEICVVLYDHFTALDCIGPYEILSRLPGARLRFVAKKAGPVTADTGMLSIVAEAALKDVSRPDIFLVPGGPGDEAAAHDAEIVDWLARAHETSKWSTSVCTGSVILGAAGILRGLDATTHWASVPRLESYGARYVHDRVVQRGKVVTAAGVSAGIDMGLTLAALEAGEDFAKMVQLGIEYDPQPPFDCGSPLKAPAHLREALQSLMEGTRAA